MSKHNCDDYRDEFCSRCVEELEARLSDAQVRVEKLEGSLGLAEDEIKRLNGLSAAQCWEDNQRLEAELELSREQEKFLTKRNVELRIMLIKGRNSLREDTHET